MTPQEIKNVLELHAAWLARKNEGKCAALTGADLCGANLTRAALTGANLTRADLTGANLYGANLTGANLYGANLCGANLTRANLCGADLTRAALTGTNLTRANLILVGQDIRGYLFYAVQDEDGVVVLTAGCRRFTGIAAARNHWAQRHLNDPVLHEDCLSLVDRCARMAAVRGWKLEPV